MIEKQQQRKRSYDWSRIPNLEIRGKGRWCHARIEMDGREHTRSLKIQADEAGANAPFVLDALRAYKLQLAHNTFAILKLTKTRENAEFSTLAEVFAAYEKVSAGRDILDATVKTTVSRFRYICAKVHGEFFNVDAARTSIITRDLAQEFEHRAIASIKALASADAAKGQPWSPEKLELRLQGAKNSAKSTLQQARALFARSVLDSVHYRDIGLPDIKPFMEYRISGTTIAAFVPPPAEVWQRIIADLPALKEASIAQWLAFQLGVNCGLRRSSARNARWGWIVENTDGSAEMRIGRAKGNNSSVTLAPEVWTDMKAEYLRQKSSGTEPVYIIPGTHETPTARTAAARAGQPVDLLEPTRDEVIVAVVAWLRARGMTVDVARCPFHTLRKVFGNHMRQAHGLDEAQKALGHSSNRLTHAVYSDHRSTKHVRVV